jgi:hypothetical protein
MQALARQLKKLKLIEAQVAQLAETGMLCLFYACIYANSITK